MKEELVKLGFSDNEAKTYLELLRIGATTTTVLAKKLNLHRGYIYEILDKLIERGVVSSIKKNGKKHFEAVPPTEILSIIEEQKNNITKYEKDFTKILPELNKLRDLSKTKQNVLLFEGRKALKTILEEIIQNKKPIFVFGAAGKFPSEMKSYYHLWNKKRAKNKIPLKIIYNQKEIGEKEVSTEETKYVEKKYLAFDKNNPTSTMLYSNKIAIIIWVDEPIITLIESKEAHSLYRRYFETFWNQAKEF